MSGNGEHKIR